MTTTDGRQLGGLLAPPTIPLDALSYGLRMSDSNFELPSCRVWQALPGSHVRAQPCAALRCVAARAMRASRATPNPDPCPHPCPCPPAPACARQAWWAPKTILRLSRAVARALVEHARASANAPIPAALAALPGLAAAGAEAGDILLGVCPARDDSTCDHPRMADTHFVTGTGLKKGRVRRAACSGGRAGGRVSAYHAAPSRASLAWPLT